MTRTLSIADLRKAGACAEALELAATLYGSAHVPVTIETVTPLAKYVYWAAIRLLSHPAREQYLKATALAREQYDKATAPALERYRKATGPAHEQYLKATDLANEQYLKATAPALEQYSAVCVAAFVTAFNSDTTEH